MPNTIRPDIVVIGAGSGGLSVAAGAAQLGAMLGTQVLTLYVRRW